MTLLRKEISIFNGATRDCPPHFARRDGAQFAVPGLEASERVDSDSGNGYPFDVETPFATSSPLEATVLRH